MGLGLPHCHTLPLPAAGEPGHLTVSGVEHLHVTAHVPKAQYNSSVIFVATDCMLLSRLSAVVSTTLYRAFESLQYSRRQVL